MLFFAVPRPRLKKSVTIRFQKLTKNIKISKWRQNCLQWHCCSTLLGYFVTIIVASIIYQSREWVEKFQVMRALAEQFTKVEWHIKNAKSEMFVALFEKQFLKSALLAHTPFWLCFLSCHQKFLAWWWFLKVKKITPSTFLTLFKSLLENLQALLALGGAFWKLHPVMLLQLVFISSHSCNMSYHDL